MINFIFSSLLYIDASSKKSKEGTESSKNEFAPFKSCQMKVGVVFVWKCVGIFNSEKSFLASTWLLRHFYAQLTLKRLKMLLQWAYIVLPGLWKSLAFQSPFIIFIDNWVINLVSHAKRHSLLRLIIIEAMILILAIILWLLFSRGFFLNVWNIFKKKRATICLFWIDIFSTTTHKSFLQKNYGSVDAILKGFFVYLKTILFRMLAFLLFKTNF